MQVQVQNTLLQALTRDDLARLLPYFETVDLPHLFTITLPDQPTDHTYFVNTGIGSVVIQRPGLKTAEVCIFGREGMWPMTAVLGANSLPFRSFMQVGGHGLRIANAALSAACLDSLSLRLMLTRYVHTVSLQMGFTAYSNATLPVEQRLARWILMCHDRTDGDTIELTHEFLAAMLAVRRQSVTTTLHILEGNHLITALRGTIIVRDRAGLERLAGPGYGVAEAEYRSLIGSLRP